MNVARRISLESDSDSESENSEVAENNQVFIDDGVTEENAIAEMNESGVGGDSDDEDGDFLQEIQDCTAEVSRFRISELDFDEAAVVDGVDELEIENGGANDSDSDDDGFEIRKLQRIFGPQIPADWTAPAPKTSKGQPRLFSQVDNPGEWDEYCYRPKFQSKGQKKYIHHSLPTGVVPVPENNDGKRVVDGWEFFYQGWEGDQDQSFRDGATKDNVFPDERLGCLDVELLKKLGLTKERVVDCDALFFHQLLLPMCRPSKSGVENDPRKGFYDNVEGYSNAYALSELKMGSTYGHNFRAISIPELIHFDGVVVRDGVKGGTSGAIYRRWIPDGADCCEKVMDSINFSRWLEVKRCMKLNNNLIAKKKGDENYDPAYKYDFIWKVLFYNINTITKEADLDLCGDETSWAHSGFSDVTGRILKKPRVSKGGQTVIVSDVSRNRPRAYIHRHKLLDHPDGVNAKGQAEVIHITNKIGKMLMN